MKIYAKQIPPEHQESPLFLGDEFFPDNIILNGNRQFNSHTTPEYDHFCRYFEEMAGEWENANHRYTYTPDGYEVKRIRPEITLGELLRDYGFYRADKKGWTNAQKHKWRKLMEEGAPDEDGNALAALELMTGEPWAAKTIRGTCQGDWQQVFYPVNQWSASALNEFEIEYFNTGSEWIVHDEGGDPEGPEDISGFSMYCTAWDDEGIKKQIAAAVGNEVSADDVTLYSFKGWSRSPMYAPAI